MSEELEKLSLPDLLQSLEDRRRARGDAQQAHEQGGVGAKKSLEEKEEAVELAERELVGRLQKGTVDPTKLSQKQLLDLYNAMKPEPQSFTFPTGTGSQEVDDANERWAEQWGKHREAVNQALEQRLKQTGGQTFAMQNTDQVAHVTGIPGTGGNRFLS